jgi:uroporphyrinogen decarboxylase
MNSRQRFLETMLSGQPDRVPYFEEGIRKDVINAWRKQGLAANADLGAMFQTDEREEIYLDVDPHPFPTKWPSKPEELKSYGRRFNAGDRSRYPEHWKQRLQAWKERSHVLMLRVHIGFFESMGVNGWGRFRELMVQLRNAPALIKAMMQIQGECIAKVTERVLQQVEIDAAVFSEPIGDNNGPLISPKMYAELVMPGYRPILDALKRYSVKVVILRTYANCRLLIPVLLENDIDCLWACEVNNEAMDYRSLRNEFGRDLQLIGGIDLDVLRKDKESIRKEVEEKVPPLITQGGYVPLADGRVRADIPFENYVYYRQLLEKVARG